MVSVVNSGFCAAIVAIKLLAKGFTATVFRTTNSFSVCSGSKWVAVRFAPFSRVRQVIVLALICRNANSAHPCCRMLSLARDIQKYAVFATFYNSLIRKSILLRSLQIEQVREAVNWLVKYRSIPAYIRTNSCPIVQGNDCCKRTEDGDNGIVWW